MTDQQSSAKTGSFSQSLSTSPSKPGEMRRSGNDRRQDAQQTATNRRRQTDRRELLKDMDDIIARYSKIPLFKGLSREQMTKILRICSKKKIPNAYTIYKTGQESKDMYILLKGLVKVLLTSGEVWTKVAPFGTIGETRLFTCEHISGDIITDTECIALKISKQELYRVFETAQDLYVKLLQNIIRSLTEKLKKDHDEIENLNYRLQSLDQI